LADLDEKSIEVVTRKIRAGADERGMLVFG
jgi:hypothetical protein